MKRPLPNKVGVVALCYFVFLFAPGTSQAGSGEALQELEKISFFPFGGIGIVGSRAPGDTLLLQLAKDHNNATLFHSLWNDGDNEAKCYALLGLYWLKDPEADRFAETFASGHISVATARGCTVGIREEVASFIATFKSGQHIRYYFPELAASH